MKAMFWTISIMAAVLLWLGDTLNEIVAQF